MSIEETLARLALNTNRIADALEAIAGSQGIVPDAPAEEAPAAPAKAATKKKTTKKKAAKKKTAKKKTAKKTAVGKKKKEPEAETELTVKDDVRPVLKRLRDEVNHAAVKSLLKKYGASTIPQLEPKHFAGIIADALAELGEDDLDDDIDDDQDDLFDDLDDEDDDDDDL